jgi:acetyl-CoA synthetase
VNDVTSFPVPQFTAARTNCTAEEYEALYRRSLEDPDGFWRDQVDLLDWVKRPEIMGNWSFDPVEIKWFEDGILNACFNCVDRHLEKRSEQRAIVWEADEIAGAGRVLTYKELHREICLFANVLKGLGVKKGDRVTIYLPMIPEAAIAMLACARIGAVHSVIFAGFSAEAIAGRIEDADSRFLITADEGRRGGKTIPLKNTVDEAISRADRVQKVLVVQHTGAKVPMAAGRDHWWHELRETVSADCAPEPMGAEDPLFILYTSGSTGKPKGVLHTTGGYLLWCALTFKYVFDWDPEDKDALHWCTADVGWVTGHSYIVYGPLAMGASTLMFEGVPNHPDTGRFWAVVEKHRPQTFYTAPTALRALMRDGEAPVLRHDLSSLRLLGTVGEPINPEAWLWYNRTVGKGKLPIVDTWWQTETGGILISPLPGAIPTKPGSATKPFFGIEPALVDAGGSFIEGEGSGNLVLKRSWPGQMRSVYGDHQRFVETYFRTYKGLYFTGDGARRDEDGYWWITGRVDDVLNVSGHRLGTAEVESALVGHPAVAEAAVVGFPHDIKGQGLYCYVTTKVGIEPDAALETALKEEVRREIGAIATPDHIPFTPALPKTRSGKIMRRILRKIAGNDFAGLGDTTTLADPSVVDALIEARRGNAPR